MLYLNLNENDCLPNIEHGCKDETESNEFKPLITNGEFTLTFTSDELMDKEELIAALGVDSSKLPDSFDIQYIKLVQARKHKKKRINKKWIKRYGYKQKLCETKGWKVKSYTDGSVEFVK